MENKIVLDVREDIGGGNDPFTKIMKTIEAFNESDVLELHTPFLPKPLLNVMKSKGFNHDTEEVANDHFITTFKK